MILGKPTYQDPIWFGKWRIFHCEQQLAGKFCYLHDGYDGAPDANDDRYGYAQSIEEAREDIVERFGDPLKSDIQDKLASWEHIRDELRKQPKPYDRHAKTRLRIAEYWCGQLRRQIEGSGQ